MVLDHLNANCEDTYHTLISVLLDHVMEYGVYFFGSMFLGCYYM